MNPSNFFDLIPSFTSGVKALHNELIGVAFILAFAGLTVHASVALVRKDIAHMWPTLMRLALIPILIGALEVWGNMVVAAVQGLISDVGAGGSGGNIFTDYQAAIARKLGTAAATANISQANQSSAVPAAEGDTSRGFTSQPLSGVMLTHYAYPGDSTPDSKSAQGIGAFSFSSAPGSLIPVYSAALTASAAQQYNLQPGQSFSVTTASGQTYNLVYADVAPESDARVDIYDPNGVLPGGNSFSDSLTSINGGPVVQGQSGLASMMPNPGGSIGDELMWAFTLAISWLASGVMWLMQIAQQLLFLIEIAISPAFIAMLMIPALTHLARRFFMLLVAICLWPLAWAICDLVTKALIDLAVNPTNSGGLGTANFASLVAGPLPGLAYLIVVAIWVIGSTLLAPVFIGVLLAVGGGTATAAIFGATLGAAASRAVGSASAAAGGPAGIAGVIGQFGGNGSSAGVSRMSGPVQNYARRPMSEREEA
ncbi:MAG: hypothetical protein WB586_24095 [Chthoniobacterales bacterium]